jgi:hypothetical protein
MSTDDFASIFFRFACPFLLFGAPLLLFALFNAPNPPQDHLSVGWYIFFSVICSLTTWFSFQYCRNEMGWFGGKKNK